MCAHLTFTYGLALSLGKVYVSRICASDAFSQQICVNIFQLELSVGSGALRFVILLIKFYGMLEYDFGHFPKWIWLRVATTESSDAGICWISTIYQRRKQQHMSYTGTERVEKKCVFVCSLSPFRSSKLTIYEYLWLFRDETMALISMQCWKSGWQRSHTVCSTRLK